MKPLLVAIAAVRKQERLMLIHRRSEGTFGDFWALPGGKVEFGEHIAATAVREIKEETGLTTRFVRDLGVVSEFVHDGKEKHFVLHLCELEPVSGEITEKDEGEPKWFTLDEITAMKDQIVPSDYLMIQHMIITHKKHYWESEITIRDGVATITKFD